MRATDTQMPLYAIPRIRKLKGPADVANAFNHNHRLTMPDHVDSNGPPPLHLIDPSDDHLGLLDERLALAGMTRAKANGQILAVEIVLTVSKKFFEDGGPERLALWIEANRNWLRDRYGDRLISAVVHLDEETPHIHAILVPLVEAVPKVRGRPPSDPARRAQRELRNDEAKPRPVLSYNRLFGGSAVTLSQLHDDYATAMAPFGLVRGEQHRIVDVVDLGEGVVRPIKPRRTRHISPHNRRLALLAEASRNQAAAAEERRRAQGDREVAHAERSSMERAREAADMQNALASGHARAAAADRATSLAELEAAERLRRQAEATTQQAEKILREARASRALADEERAEAAAERQRLVAMQSAHTGQMKALSEAVARPAAALRFADGKLSCNPSALSPEAQAAWRMKWSIEGLTIAKCLAATSDDLDRRRRLLETQQSKQDRAAREADELRRQQDAFAEGERQRLLADLHAKQHAFETARKAKVKQLEDVNSDLERQQVLQVAWTLCLGQVADGKLDLHEDGTWTTVKGGVALTVDPDLAVMLAHLPAEFVQCARVVQDAREAAEAAFLRERRLIMALEMAEAALATLQASKSKLAEQEKAIGTASLRAAQQAAKEAIYGR